MKQFQGRTAVITGAGSGFGLEVARLAAAKGMKLALVDVQQDALDQAAAELKAAGADVLASRVDVSDGAQMEALGAAVKARFGAPHFVFNNAGIGSGGLIWENTLKDWEWVLGVNVMGVVHGVRVFTPMMLEAAALRPGLRGSHRQHGFDGRAAEPAEHGRLQRQQACGGLPERDAVPGPAPGHRADRRLRAVPVLRPDRDLAERAQPARGAARVDGTADEEPADRRAP